MSRDSYEAATSRRAFLGGVAGSMAVIAGCSEVSAGDYAIASIEETEHINSVEVQNLPVDDGLNLLIDVETAPPFNAIVALDSNGEALNAVTVEIGDNPELFIPGDPIGELRLLLMKGASVDCFGDMCSASGGEKLAEVKMEIEYAE